MFATLRKWHDRLLATNAAIYYQRGPSGPIMEEWKQRGFGSFLRHLLRLEREERLALVAVIKCWYYKQILLSQVTGVGKGLKVGPEPIRVSRSNRGKLALGNGVVLYSPCEFVITTHIYSESTIEIGDNTRIGSNSSLRAAKHIRVGSGCLISPWVRIADYNGHPIQPGTGRIGAVTPADEVEPVFIGNNVWIGENAFIQKGVTIGDDSIVGANSVVTKDVPEGTIVRGIPARVAVRLADLNRKPAAATEFAAAVGSEGDGKRQA